MKFTYEINNETPGEKKRFIRRMFDAIVPTYDLLNHLLSMGIDQIWRRKTLRLLNLTRDSSVIDLCCGTGDLSRLLSKKTDFVVSLDFSQQMILAGITKGAITGYPLTADASKIPLKKESFIAATVAFGIRNIPDIDIFLSEVGDILKPGGRFAILELVRPRNPVIGFFYNLYLKKILPFIGGLVSGEPRAYRYLSETISSFIDPNELKRLLQSHGFSRVEILPQTLGIAAIVLSTKEETS